VRVRVGQQKSHYLLRPVTTLSQGQTHEIVAFYVACHGNGAECATVTALVSSGLDVKRALDHRLTASLVFLSGAQSHLPKASQSICAPSITPRRVKILTSDFSDGLIGRLCANHPCANTVTTFNFVLVHFFTPV